MPGLSKGRDEASALSSPVLPSSWPASGEILPLQWRQIDFAAGEIHPRRTRHGEGGRLLILADTGEQAAVLHCADQHVAIEREAEAAEHSDLGYIRIIANHGSDTIFKFFSHRTFQSFNFTAEYGWDSKRPQMAFHLRLWPERTAAE